MQPLAFMNNMDYKRLPLEDRPFQLDEHGPVFILGCPRSGTTFLSHCIGALNGCREYVGVLAPPRLMHLVATTPCVDDQQRILLCVRDIFWQTFWRSEFFRKHKIGLFLDRRVSLSSLLSRPSLEGVTFCYKEPFLCFAATQFADHFPNSRFIHIIRDGRDNADSMCRTYGDALSDEILASDSLSLNKVSEIGFWRRIEGFNFPYWIKADEIDNFRRSTPYGRYVRLWKEMTERALLLASIFPGSRYLEVRYENIVKNPVEEGMRIRSFLGKSARASYARMLGSAYSSSIGISKANQNAQMMSEAMGIAGPLLSSLGYD